MYLPRHFAEERVEVLAAFIREHPLATLVTSDGTEMVASHLPMLWDPDPAPYGTLTGHVARPNPQARVSGDALAVFLGPEAYVSPSWYPSKREHGRAVPTWNYVAVHAYGAIEIVDDPAWLLAFVTRLTAEHERALPEPWHPGDAPESFIARMLKGIAGIRIPVRRLEGKWKLGQNRPDADQVGAVAGLEARGDPKSVALARVIAARRRDR